MHPPPWFITFWHWFAGQDASLRRHVLYCLASAQLSLVCVGVLWHSHAMGLLPQSVAVAITVPIVLSWSVMFVLVRSGWSARFADPVLSLPVAMVAVLITVAAYVLIGDFRADVVVLMAQAIAVTMFRIRPKQVMFLGVWTVCWLLLAQAGLAAGVFGPQVSPSLMAAHAAVSTATLLALALVAMWVSEIRLKITRGAQKLQDTLAQVQALATTDMLTGLLNRRQMEEVILAELSLARRQGQPLCLAMVDLDHFKRINDVHGHRMGDEVLRRFATLLQTDLRQVDVCGRWGGEEFVILMPHVGLNQAHQALDRLRLRLSELPMGEQAPLFMTLSAGVALWMPDEALEHWLERADQAMYAAKANGRNRVEMSFLQPVTATAVFHA